MICCDQPMDILDLTGAVLVPAFAPRALDFYVAPEPASTVPSSTIVRAWRCATCGMTTA